MKALFKPISSMFGKKDDDNSSQEQDGSTQTEQTNPVRLMDDHGLAKRYCDTFTAIQTVQTKLEKLIETKELIAEERFNSLNDQYTSFLNKHAPNFNRLSEEINRRIDVYIEEKKEAADKFTEIKKRIQQEAKLLEVGAISKEEYIEKIQNFKPEEKEYKEKYKTSQERITILKDAKNNKYTPPPELTSEDESNNKEDNKSSDKTGETDEAKKQHANLSKVYTGKEVNIKIECGTNLNVKIEGIAIPITANFIGADKYEYIIITHPSPYASVKPKLFPGNIITIECQFDGNMFVFSSPIIENLTKPIKAIVLEYPHQITVKIIRSLSRIACRLPSTLSFKGLSKDSIINDISPNGCRIEVIYNPNEKNYIARTNESIKIECSFPGDTQVYTVSGIIRNVRKKELVLLYGVQFSDISESTRKVIEKYLSTLQS